MKLELEGSLPLGAFEEGSVPSGGYPSSCRRRLSPPGPPDLVQAWEARQASSLLPLHWLLEAEFTPGRDDGQAALKVVADEVADTVKDPVLRPDLCRKQTES